MTLSSPKPVSIIALASLLLAACSEPNQTLASGSLTTQAKQANLSVSGLSSGAYMALQFHLAFSEQVIGSGLIAGGPYYCAQGSIGNALQNCVANSDSTIDLSAINATIIGYQKAGKLADPKYNQDDKVWLLHGTLDSRIHRSVADTLAKQIDTLFKPVNIEYLSTQAFSHVIPTLNAGAACTESTAPFIGNCNYDAAGELLRYISPMSQPKSTQSNELLSQNLVAFKQSDYAGEHADTLGTEAYLYVPENCKESDSCDIHISFHGCNQNAEAIGNEYAKNAGFNAWAQTNNLMVLYPQTKKSTFMPLNPQACWDWWGYTGENYANKEGKQMQAVMTLVKNIPKIINNTQ